MVTVFTIALYARFTNKQSFCVAATPNSGKAQAVASGQQKQSLLLCNNPNFPSSQPVNPEISSSSNPVNPLGLDQLKRTRGVQSSILTAMALKEKRATLSEAKDIRKVHMDLNKEPLNTRFPQISY